MIRRTPKQNQEASEVRKLNGGIASSGRCLKQSQALDKRWHSNNSSDTRRIKSNLSDQLFAREKLAADLKQRLRSSNSTPAQKQHAHEQLRAIEKAQSSERTGRITGRQGELTSRERNVDRNGVLRLRNF
jgi:hypothetical protein